MIIALDYDNTFSLNPQFWSTFYYCSVANKDVEVIMVTGRRLEEPVVDAPWGMKTFYTDHKQKRKTMEEKGIHVDIWIDDKPESILFDWDEETLTISNGTFKYEVKES
jgi:hypothetical protein